MPWLLLLLLLLLYLVLLVVLDSEVVAKLRAEVVAKAEHVTVAEPGERVSPAARDAGDGRVVTLQRVELDERRRRASVCVAGPQSACACFSFFKVCVFNSNVQASKVRKSVSQISKAFGTKKSTLLLAFIYCKH